MELDEQLIKFIKFADRLDKFKRELSMKVSDYPHSDGRSIYHEINIRNIYDTSMRVDSYWNVQKDGLKNLTDNEIEELSIFGWNSTYQDEV